MSVKQERFSQISLTEINFNPDRESMERRQPLMYQPPDAPVYEEKKEAQRAAHQEWSVQRSQHLNLVNDLSSYYPFFNKATSNWINHLRRTTVNEAEVYVDISDQVQKRVRSAFNWKRKLICEFFPIVEPSSDWLIWWDVLMGMQILLMAYSTTLNLYYTWNQYDQQRFWDYWVEAPFVYFHSIVMIMWTFDIFLEFHIAYFNNGSYITTRYAVARNYFKNGFIFDFIPILMIYLTTFIPWLRHIPYVHYLVFLKVYKLVQVDNRIKDRLQLHRKSKAAYLIARLVIELLFLVHIFAAIFYSAGVHMMTTSDEWSSWLDATGNFPNIYKMSKFNQYLMSIYWSFATMTTVAYGDITPLNPLEIGVSTVTMVGAIFVFSFNVQTIFEVVDEYRETQRKFQKYLIIINRFMRDKQITYKLQNKIRKYLDHIWQQQRAREENIEDMILNQLAPQLKEELMYESYGRFLISIPWFKDFFSLEFVHALSQDVEEVHYTRDETIFLDRQSNEDDSALYFLNQGQVELFVNIDENNREDVILAKIRQGSCFGQNSFVTGQQRTCSARSRSYSQLYRVRRSKFLKRIMNYPADYERFCYLRDQIQFNKELNLMDIKCMTCQSSDHQAIECPLSHYVPVTLQEIKEKALKQLKEDERLNKPQEREKKKRRVKRREKQIYISEEQLQRAREIQEEEDNPEHIDENLAKLINLQKLMEPIEEQENENIDVIRNYQYYYPSRNVDHLLKSQEFQFLTQPKKRAVSKKFQRKGTFLMNQSTQDFPQDKTRGRNR